MGELLKLPLRAPRVPISPERARFEALFAKFHAPVWRALRRRGLDADAAADATQETFAIALTRLTDIDPAKERAFLIHTALKVAHTLRRKTVRWHLEGDLDLYRSPQREPNETRGDVELCDRALSKLSPEMAEVFVLYEIEEMSSPEIAELLDIPLGSVASRLRRAREGFREALERLERTMKREAR